MRTKVIVGGRGAIDFCVECGKTDVLGVITTDHQEICDECFEKHHEEELEEF